MRIMKCESLMDKTGKLFLDKILFPKLASPKFDGNRCYVEDDEAKSSSGKPIRNNYIRQELSKAKYTGVDGEIIVGNPTDKAVRRLTSSGVGSFDGEPDFKLYVFDFFDAPTRPFEERLVLARDLCDNERTIFVTHRVVNSVDEVLQFEKDMLDEGYEGLVLRDPKAPYKAGRSTLKQNWALKLKRFVDGEAVIIGVEELMHNDNEATKDEQGYTKRSSHKENKRGAGVMGALIVRDLKTGVEFKVGTGFTAEDRAQDWPIGRIITYKHFPIGAKDKPNLPSFVAIRSDDDIVDDPSTNPF